MRGPVRAYRPRSPPPPPPPQPPRHLTEQEELRRILRGQQQQQQPPDQSAASGPLPERPAPPQRPPPQPQPQRPTQRPGGRNIWIPVSDGCYALADGCVVRQNYTGRITINTDGRGNREVKEEPLNADAWKRFEESFTGVRKRNSTGNVPPPRPPPPKTPPTNTSGEWLTTRRPLTSTPRRPPRWVSPPPQPKRPESPPPPYQGIIVREVPQRPQSPPPPYGEVIVKGNGDNVQGKKKIILFLVFFKILKCDL